MVRCIVVLLFYKRHVHLEPINVRKRAFAVVIKDLRMRSSHLGLSNRTLNLMIRILIREKADGDLGQN